MPDNITPEEKLLKIIEAPGIGNPKTPFGAKGKAPGIKRAGAWLKGLRIDKNIFQYLDLRIANKMVASLCGFLTVFWVFDFVRVSSNLKGRFEQITQAAAIAVAQEKRISVPEVNIEEILAQAKKRNMFTFLPAKVEATPLAEAIQKTSNLKLVGIIWSDNPQVMIEDAKEQRTYLLGTGEQIGQAKIKKIFRDRVILDVEGQEQELR